MAYIYDGIRPKKLKIDLRRKRVYSITNLSAQILECIQIPQ